MNQSRPRQTRTLHVFARLEAPGKAKRVLDRAGLTRRSRRIRQALRLPPARRRRRVRGSVWAVSIVKNEADIIVASIEHLFRQAVDGVLVADNGSTDGTRELLEALATRLPLYIADDREPGHYQGQKMDVLSDWARAMGADWIIPFDADEFWFAPSQTVGQYLRSCEANIVNGQLHNLFPVPGIEFGRGPWRLETTPLHQVVKVAFRSCRYSLVSDGSNQVHRIGLSRSGLRIHRPGLSTSGLRVIHVPWRSYEQFRRKGRQGSEALRHTDLKPNIGFHWRELGALGEGEARRTWEKIVSGERVDSVCWTPGAPARLIDPFDWGSWDPDGALAADTDTPSGA